MLLKDTEGVIERIEEVLVIAYPGRLEPKLIDQLKAAMAGWEAHVAEAAVHRHIQDTRTNSRGETYGHYPPSLSQIMAHAEQIRIEEERANAPPPEPTPDPDDDRFKWMDLPPAAAAMLGKERLQVDSWRSNCIECSDRGITRFYYDPRRKRRRVWLFSEWLELPPEMRGTLQCASAVCDCSKGEFHRHRDKMTKIWHKGREHEAPVWPRLELIRKLADQRKRDDLISVGAA